MMINTVTDHRFRSEAGRLGSVEFFKDQISRNMLGWLKAYFDVHYGPFFDRMSANAIFVYERCIFILASNKPRNNETR